MRQWPWVWHAYRSWTTLKSRNGTQFSAAITYFSFLALFPLLLLAAAITGFVLSSDQHLQNELFNQIAKSVPGSFGDTLTKSIKSAINNRAGIGIIGLVGVLLTGLGWVGNLRQAIGVVAGQPPAEEKFLPSRVRNLLILGGLGLGVLISLGLTIVGTAVTDQILRSVGLEHATGVSLVITAGGIAVSLISDLLIFWWVLIQMPRLKVARPVAIKGVIMASVGFEALKLLGTFTIAKSSHSPTLGPFASLLAVLIWIELVSRFLLYCVAWMSIADEPAAAAG